MPLKFEDNWYEQNVKRFRTRDTFYQTPCFIVARFNFNYEGHIIRALRDLKTRSVKSLT